MATDFAKQMRWMQNEDLVEIASADAGKFVPEAIVAAQTELASRSLSSHDVDAIKSDLLQRTERQANVRHEELSWPRWFAFFFLGITIIGLIMFLALAATGRRRMLLDALAATLCGVAFAWILFMALMFWPW